MIEFGLLTKCLSPGRGPARRWLSHCLPASVLCCIVAPGIYAGDTVEMYLAALRAGLDARVNVALSAIEGTGRQLLAARSYVRSEAQLDARWSWNDAQIAAYSGSPEKLRLDGAIARVRCNFESANSGHTLFVNDTVRSLDRQIEKWNRSETIKRSADYMLETFRAEVAAQAFPKAKSPEGVAAFRNLLVSFKPIPTPSLAAPGLSLHGRMQAVDFQVMAGNRIVAGTDPTTVVETWEASGWKAKLQAAVIEANAGFVGPLKSPDEPWHYDFRPTAGAQLIPAACRRSASGTAASTLEFRADSFDLGDIGWLSEQADESGVDLFVSGLRAIDKDVAFLFGRVGVAAGTLRSFLLRTGDGGKSWHEEMTPVLGSELMHVAFSDRQHGWALAQWSVEGPGTILLFGSTDGGRTWRQLPDIQAQGHTAPDGFPLRMTFTSARNGEIEFAYDDESASIDDTQVKTVTLASSDGGGTWRVARRETRKWSPVEAPDTHRDRGFDSTDWELDTHGLGDPIVVRRFDRGQNHWHVTTLPTHFQYARGRVLASP